MTPAKADAPTAPDEIEAAEADIAAKTAEIDQLDLDIAADVASRDKLTVDGNREIAARGNLVGVSPQTGQPSEANQREMERHYEADQARAAQISEITNRIRQRADRRRALRSEIESLRKQVRRLVDERTAQQTAAMTVPTPDERAGQLAVIAALEDEIASFQGRWDTLADEGDVERLAVLRARRDRATLELRVARVNLAEGDLARVTRDMAALQVQTTTLGAALDQAEAALLQAQADRDRAVNELRGIRYEHDELRRRARKIQQQLDTHRQTLGAN